MTTTMTILDGGLSTQLEAMGQDLRDSLWSARLLRDDPAAVVQAHLAFLRAGAQIVTTASYQASYSGFAAAGIGEDETTTLLRRSVDLAREAVAQHEAETGQRARVAASVGPYGASLADGSEYRGRYGLTVPELREWHTRRLEVLADTDADLLACETIPDLDEAEALVGLLAGAGRDAWLSYSVEGFATRAGQPLDAAFSVARGITELVAVGINCSAPHDVLPAVEAAAAIGIPAVVYPNSGEAWEASERRWVGTGTTLADDAPGWVDAGARYVGGCCRVTPADITALADAVT